MARHGRPGGTAWGGRVVFNAAGRAIDPHGGGFLSRGKIAAREREYHKAQDRRELLAAREELNRLARREELSHARAPQFSTEKPSPASSRRLRVPAGLPGAGTFLPVGIRGEIQLARIEMIVRGEETEFVTVHVGGTEWRGRNNMESLMRGVAGAVIADAINAGSSAAAGSTVDDISGLTLKMEADGYDALDEWRTDGDVWIEPE